MIIKNNILDKRINWVSDPEPGHLVQFYSSDARLLRLLSEYVRTGLADKETCLVIATPDHVRKLDDQLLATGIDISSVRKNGLYATLDAGQTLAKFMINDLPDRKLFFDVIGNIMKSSIQKGSPVRAYGEMVALLWKAGNKDAVIQLENLWNELGNIYDFSLFCAYPELQFVMDQDAREEIHACHNSTLPSVALAGILR